MKKLFIPIACLLAGYGVQAQSLHFGLKAGPNLGKINGQSFKDGFEWGYQVGAWATLDLSDNIGIQPELVFSQTNTKTKTSSDNILIPNLNAHLNYLSVPVLLNINSGNILTFQLGPQFSINTTKGKSLTEEGEDAFKGGDVAAVGGIQLNLSKLRLYGRYVIGITKISDLETQEKWRTQNFQFGLGYKIF
ncbi:MAG: porin family protein [Chitinophagaceae bacterium]